MLELSKAAQFAPCVTTRATQKKCRVVVGGDFLLRVMEHPFADLMHVPERCDAGVCITDATKRLPRPLQSTHFYLLLLPVVSCGRQ